MNTVTKITDRTWAEIDLKALKHNLDLAINLSKRPVMCVIKANAYGHGAVECGRFLQENGASAFAVACLEEANELRMGGITLPILILGYTPAEYAAELASLDIIQTVVDVSHAMQLSTEAQKHNVTVKVHIKVDTGMSRAGLLAQGHDNIGTAIEQAVRICSMNNLSVLGMYTHLSVADTPSQLEYTSWQLDNFNAVRNGLRERGIELTCCHAGNSAAIMNHKNAHFDMVREGIMLYGLYPDSVPVENGPLAPVMTLKSRVSQVRDLPAGTTVSYGRTFAADKPIKTAVIVAGYADGYPRRLSNNAYVVIKGKKYNQVGRVCMDMIMCNATNADVERGDEVILFGKGGMSTEEVSQIVGTINYELTCLVTARARRLYIS